MKLHNSFEKKNNMDKIKHYWNMAQSINFQDKKFSNLYSAYFVQLCKRNVDNEELPKHQFGPFMMCTFCGSYWSKTAPRYKILPGRVCSKSIQKIQNNKEQDIAITKFQKTLLQKCLKNTKNKLVIKCSLCSKPSKLFFNKPIKVKQENKKNLVETNSNKKKKKKRKDKTAGLNISNSTISSPNTSATVNNLKKIQSNTKVKTNRQSQIFNRKGSTALQKVRKLNLSKLNSVLNESSKKNDAKSNLNEFLKELY